MRRAAIAAAVFAVGLAGCGGGAPTGPLGSTLTRTYHDNGAAVPVRGPGEKLMPRTELGAKTTPGRTLATLVQFTDTHVRDEESPARVAFLDRLGGPFQSVFRPQEALTTQVLDAAVRSADAAHPDLTVLTGDLIDNDQSNELTQLLATLKGGRVDPDSGRPGYSGVQDADDADPAYYRPDVDPPQHAGLLDAAQRPFVSPGLTGRIAAVPGNHDILVAGEVAATPQTNAVAVGDRRVVDPGNVKIPRQETAARAAVDRLLSRGRLPGRTTYDPPDPTRRELTAQQWLDRVRAAGISAGAAGSPRADQVIDVGAKVRVVQLDVTKRSGLDQGRIVPGQLQFLEQALRTGRWVVVVTHEPLRKVLGAAPIVAQLRASHHVVATIAGDTHHDSLTTAPSAGGGYWQITTTALADWPQQGRVIQLRQTARGVAIDTWKLDTAPGKLPDIARQLALIDAQGGRPNGNAGQRSDRNARLFLDRR